MREARGGITWQADVLEGRADGRPPLVLLHGPAFDRGTWRPALAELCVADPGRQVLALDLAGHDGSSPPRRYDIDSVLEAVHEAVRWTRLDTPVVVGHAMAAVIATVYAARYPARGVINVNQWLRAEPPAAPGWPPDALAVDIQAVLAKIGAAEIDYLFIAGCEVEPGYRRWLRRLVPRASIEVFPGSGHLPHLDCPQRFAACLATMGRWPGVA